MHPTYKPDLTFRYNDNLYKIWDQHTLDNKDQFVTDFIAAIEEGIMNYVSYLYVMVAYIPEGFEEDVNYILTLIKLSNIVPKKPLFASKATILKSRFTG